MHMLVLKGKGAMVGGRTSNAVHYKSLLTTSLVFSSVLGR